MDEPVESEPPALIQPGGVRNASLNWPQRQYVFDDLGDAEECLNKPHPELAGLTPMEAARSEIGARRAAHILDSIFYGLPV
jgi:uncharacterized protein (DUF2384 family)